MANVNADQSLNGPVVYPLVSRSLNTTSFGGAGQWQPILADDDGAILVRPVTTNLRTQRFLDDNTDNVAPVGVPDDLAGVMGRLALYDEVGNRWDRQGGQPYVASAADTVFSTESRMVPTASRPYLHDPDSSIAARMTVGDDAAESDAPIGRTVYPSDSRPRVWSETDGAWIRQHGNDAITILASAARTATNSSATFKNPNHRAAHFIVDVTAIAATPSVVFSIEAFDVASGTFYPILESPAITSVGTTVLKVGIGFTPIPNLTANNLIPFSYRVTATHADADSITYSVGANLSV